MDTWIALSTFALLPMLVRIPRALSPLRVGSGDPPRFTRPFKSYALHAFTGYASEVLQRGDSITTGQIGSTNNPDGSVTSVRGSITTEVVVTDQFFLTGADGRPRGRFSSQDSRPRSARATSCRSRGRSSGFAARGRTS